MKRQQKTHQNLYAQGRVLIPMRPHRRHRLSSTRAMLSKTRRGANRPAHGQATTPSLRRGNDRIPRLSISANILRVQHHLGLVRRSRRRKTEADSPQLNALLEIVLMSTAGYGPVSTFIVVVMEAAETESEVVNERAAQSSRGLGQVLPRRPCSAGNLYEGKK